MERSTDWGRSRWVALACVIALHVTIIIALARLQWRQHIAQLYTPLLMLPSNTRPVESPGDRHSSKKNVQALPVTAAPAPLPSLSPDVIAPIEKAPIDWAEEAKRVARELASRDAKSTVSRAPTASGLSDLSSWFPPPAHHAGEQYTNESGERIVWISDKCYQVSGSSLLTVPDVFSKAMLPKTLCPGNSRKPRGDLFKDLPAYKKHHPEE